MSRPLSLTIKLTALVVFAVLFGATLVALSVKDRRHENTESFAWGKESTVERKFTVKDGDRLVVDADIGDISINGTEGNEVTVRVYQTGSEEKKNRTRFDFDQSGNVVTVKGRLQRKYFNFFGDMELGVRFEIQVPRNFDLHMQTSGGNITIDGVHGSIFGETSGGDVEVDKIDGKAKLTTSGGNVKLTDSKGDLTFETSGGDIVGEDLGGNIHVETSGGNINIRRTDASLYGETSGGDIRAELRDNKGIDLSTSGGNVVVNLPKSAAGDVDAETTGGDVSCDFAFSGKLKDGSLHGQINGGGLRIRLGTSGGDIVIHSVE
ncbi:MAG TPA: DUF4097 family beta strand repeat-containing protein [Bacteroidota bacterium]|jgi:DUF4097 and DUF4098 domain-containing protein YvlB|nr:DUF4097 family beta strand repeat-containing protein [Bacteroidota bacterium]